LLKRPFFRPQPIQHRTPVWLADRCRVVLSGLKYHSWLFDRSILPRCWEGAKSVAGKELILDFSEYDVDRVIADIHVIRRYNPQRYEMEQLTAIVYEDPERQICVGYKDESRDEFWNRGHMPGMPLLPGVLMCESAAQMNSYYAQKHDLLGAEMVGFGGMEEIRFRDPVLPGERLVIVSEVLKVRRGAMMVSRFQGFVNQSLVVEGKIKGVPLPMARLAGQSSR
jgi:3-hydroxyacyl-[acyl-carrier-protein] dehydratase